MEKFKGMQDCFREHPEVYADGEFSSSPFFRDERQELMVIGIRNYGRR